MDILQSIKIIQNPDKERLHQSSTCLCSIPVISCCHRQLQHFFYIPRQPEIESTRQGCNLRTRLVIEKMTNMIDRIQVSRVSWYGLLGDHGKVTPGSPII